MFKVVNEKVGRTYQSQQKMTENNKYKHYRLDIGIRKEAAYLNCKFSFLFLYFYLVCSMIVEVNTFECM